MKLSQPSFSKGEVSPGIWGRTDTAAYRVALRTARNLIVHPEGGASNRAGTLFVGHCLSNHVTSRLKRFQFKSEDSYILEFGHLTMRVIRNHAYVTEAAKTVTAGTANTLTAATHGFSVGDRVYVDGIIGMTGINGRYLDITAVTTNTMTLADPLTGSSISAGGVYAAGGTVARVYTLITPYAAADLFRLKFTQSADVMTITHRSYGIRRLSRTAHASWTLAEPTFSPSVNPPTNVAVAVNTAGAVTASYKVTATDATTGEESLAGTRATTAISGATQANPVVITAAGHGIANGDEVYITGITGMTELNGRQFIASNVAANTLELLNENGTSYNAYSAGGTVGRTFYTVTNSAVASDNTISWTAVANASRYTIYKAKNGVYGLIGEATGTSFEDDNMDPDTSVSPPTSRNPFRGSGNYPGASSYFEQRQVYGGSTNAPDTSEYSQTGGYNNFTRSSPIRDDDAITATLNSAQVNEIRHFVPGNDLLVLTSGAVWRINSGPDGVFAATTIKQKPQSGWGSGHQTPIQIGNAVLYVQSNNIAVRSIGYSFQNDAYLSSDLTTLSAHLFKKKTGALTITDWAFNSTPEPIVHCIRDDGAALTMTFQQEQEVVGWTRWETEGWFEAVETLQSDLTEPDDTTYFVVLRNVNGTLARFVERVHTRRFEAVEDAYFVDCGVSYDPAIAITNVSLTNPVMIDVASHSYSNGDEVEISDVEWYPTVDADTGTETDPDQLNGTRYTVTVISSTRLQLNGEDATGWNARRQGGYVRKVTQTVTGLHHLEGETVVALANGNVASNLTVTNGSVTLPAKASRVHVGLPYVADFQTLDMSPPQGTFTGSKAKAATAVVQVERTRGILVGPDESNIYEVNQRQFENYDDPTELATGTFEVTLASSWSTAHRLFIRQKYPLPMTIQAVVPDYEVED